MKLIKKINRNHFLRLMIFVAIIILHIFLRLNSNPILAGSDSYELLSLEAGKSVYFDVINFFLSSLLIIDIQQISIVYIIINSLLFIIGFLSLELLLRKTKENKKLIIMSALALNPVIPFLILSANIITPAICLFALSLVFLRKKKRVISIILLALIVLVDAYIFALLFLIYSLYFVKDRKKNLYYASYAVLGVVFLALLMLGKYFWSAKFHAFSPSFLDLGNISGLSIPIFLLFLISLVYNWKRRHTIINLVSVLLIFLCFIEYTAANILTLFFSLYAGNTIYILVEKTWEIKKLKQITILLIFCLLIFSSLSHSNRLSQEMPTIEFTNSMEMLHNCCETGEILSHKDYEPYFVYFLGNEGYWNSLEKDEAAIDILNSRTTAEVREKIQNKNIKYFFITHEMINGKVWQGDNQGLQFVLKNSNEFVNIHTHRTSKELYQLWMIK